MSYSDGRVLSASVIDSICDALREEIAGRGLSEPADDIFELRWDKKTDSWADDRVNQEFKEYARTVAADADNFDSLSLYRQAELRATFGDNFQYRMEVIRELFDWNGAIKYVIGLELQKLSWGEKLPWLEKLKYDDDVAASINEHVMLQYSSAS